MENYDVLYCSKCNTSYPLQSELTKCPNCETFLKVGKRQKRKVALQTVSTGKRFVHWVFDIFGIYAFAFALGIVIGLVRITQVLKDINAAVFSVSVVLAYYIFCEYLFNRTVGKLLTGTIVVTEDGSKPSLARILLRSLIRLVPFEPFSVLSSSSRMWHDSWSKTVVVDRKSLKQTNAEPPG